MGIVNVTPDSFSDGGMYASAESAVNGCFSHWYDGALWVDVGGESTRPGSDPVEESVELARVLPVLDGVGAKLEQSSTATWKSGYLSIDTMKPAVAREALRRGVVVVNDVSGLAAGDEMLEVLANSDCGYVLTHCQGRPKTMQLAPHYEDCIGEVLNFFEDRMRMLQNAGVDLERVVLDPGFGFGKTWDHNRELLLSLQRVRGLGRPVFVGLSRKSFVGRVTGGVPKERLAGTLAAETLAVWHGADILRTHEPAHTLQAARVCRAVREGWRE